MDQPLIAAILQVLKIVPKRCKISMMLVCELLGFSQI